MAEEMLVKRLQQGSEAWNQWREYQAENMRLDLSNADLSSIHLNHADLHMVRLCEAVLIDADLNEADLYSADLSGADLRNADLSHANLHRANLSGADLFEADLSEADLSEANLCDANLHGADLFEASLREADLSGADLGEAHLREANVSRAHLIGTDLTDADLHNSDLSGANVTQADLTHANLSNSELSCASLIQADLTNANLSEGDLSEANLSGADLSGTNMRGTTFWRTIVAHADLHQTVGLTEIKHRGPSDIALHTIQLPQDGSALHFLRGAGIPDEWIDFYRSTMMHPIQYHSCFISYAHQDDDLARRLHSDLQDHGVRCWFAPHDMRIGDKIRSRIDEAIHLQDKLLLILSEHSVASDWVEHEVETALAKERREKRTILFPIRLDNAILERPYTGWAATVQNERHIGDFTGWKDHDCYQAAFERLLRDLKKADHQATPASDACPSASYVHHLLPLPIDE